MLVVNVPIVDLLVINILTISEWEMLVNKN